MPFPFISRATHYEIVARADRATAKLEAENERLRGEVALAAQQLLDAKIETAKVKATLLEAMAPIPQRFRPRHPEDPKAQSETGAPLNPNDNVAIMAQARRETPTNNASHIMRTAQRLKRQAEIANSAYLASAGPIPEATQNLIDEAEAEGLRLAARGA